MDLMSDQAISIKDGAYRGIYRVVGIDQGLIYLAVIASSFEGIRKRGRKPSSPSSDALKLTECFQLLRIPKTTLEALSAEYLVETVVFNISNKALLKIDPNAQNQSKRKKTDIVRHLENISLMKDFLAIDILVEKVIKDQGFGGLVSNTARINRVSTRRIYRLLDRLIKYGFIATSLIPQFYQSGAEGVSRPWVIGGKRAGRKSIAVSHAIRNNLPVPPDSPGMSAEWIQKCLIGLKKIRTPHNSISKLYTAVMNDQFSNVIEINNNLIKLLINPAHSRPTKNQFKHFVQKLYPGLKNINRKTTDHNFNQNHRALLGTSYQGVSGPGHTYAIDSTFADIFLLSILNLNLIAGRPVLYMIVDVWSGVIVGFFICFSGPKWEMAKVALFSAVYDAESMAELRGVPYMDVFRHKPGMCAILLGDRGEYISFEAELDCCKLKIDQEFAAAYRGDGKGVVEVQFKIGKDDQFEFLPGTHDARRIEMERRKSNPDDATLTLHDYVAYVASRVRQYNLTADMSDRLTDHMKAQGILPNPAAIWDYGHDIGIGFKRHIPEDQLVRTLLPKVPAKSSPHGIQANNRLYGDQDIQDDVALAGMARNFSESDVNAWIYPGNIQQIWTDDGCKEGLRIVQRKDSDSSYVTEEEFQDADYIARMARLLQEHAKEDVRIQERQIQESVVKNSKDAKKRADQPIPSNKQNLTENRQTEHQHMMHQEAAGNKPPVTSSSIEVPNDAEATFTFENWLQSQILGNEND